jgi:hypothetical protein
VRYAVGKGFGYVTVGVSMACHLVINLPACAVKIKAL